MKIAFFGATAAALLAVADAALNVTTGRGSPGCGKRVPKTGGNDFTPMFDVDGVNRMFRTYTPSQYDKDTPQPLILAFHGTAKTQQSLTLQSQFSDKSVNRNMMVQYMTAYKGRWYGPSHAYPEADDLRYTEMALEHLMNNYCIDVDRVYLVGHTGGAGFANILACDPRFSRHFAGMALMAPTLYRDLDDDYCKHANVPMPILEVHGNNDGTSPYWGLPNRVVGAIPAIPDWVRRWVRRNGCDPTPRKTKLVMGEDVFSDKYTCHGHFGFVEHIRAMRHGYNWMTKHAVLDISPIMISFLNSHIRPGNMSIPLDDKGNFTCLGSYTPPADWPGHANFTSSANSTIPGTSTSSGNRTATHSSTTHGSTAHSPPPHWPTFHSPPPPSTYGSTHTIPSGITSSTDSAQPGSSKETSTGYYDRPSYHRGG